MRQHLGVWGKAPAGVQRAAPSGARRVGGLSGEECPPHRRPLRRGVPAAQAAPPARSADSTLARWTKGSGFFNRGLSLPPILRVSPEKPYLTACKKGRNILYCFHIHRGAETGYTAPSAPAASAKGLYRNNLRPWPAHLAATPYYFCTVPNDFRS